MNYVQQGDVLLTKVNQDHFKNGIQPTLILHKGDVHSHNVSSPIYIDEDMINVPERTMLTHDEHRPIVLEAGVYKKSIVVECDPSTQVTRPVID